MKDYEITVSLTHFGEGVLAKAEIQGAEIVASAEGVKGPKAVL